MRCAISTVKIDKPRRRRKPQSFNDGADRATALCNHYGVKECKATWVHGADLQRRIATGF